MNRKVFLQMMLPAIVTGLLIAVVARSANSPAQDKMRRFEIQQIMQAVVDAADEATRTTEKQRSLVRSLSDGAKSPQTGRLTPREVAREKAVLQQLEAHARRTAEVLESIKRLAAESDPSQVGDALKLLATVSMGKAQTASDEASRAAEKQRTLVKSSQTLRSPRNSGIGGGISGKATDDNDERRESGRFTSREIAREKAVLQQLEANARRAAEVLESVKRLAAELERQTRR